ncbi:MAG TPA: oxidoreductase [Stenotrophobium sp.]|jgi:NAD(P)-dependent dehydrogenase (short-subunit alcohol dehydrogenase family)|nr:oxidoreductase [Stenotrophobium sp.]
MNDAAPAGKIWLITGCSRGLGRALAEAVVASGARLIATARDAHTLDALEKLAPDRVQTLSMDVNDEAEVRAGVTRAVAAFGRVDVLVNNAGYGLLGAVEEVSDSEARAQMETNVFGALRVTRALLPYLREQGGGHILNISSVAGIVSTPGLGLYNASKYALEGYSEALALELAPMGIRVTIVEPGPFRTDWAGSSMAQAARTLDAYDATAGATARLLKSYSGRQPGDPEKAAAAMLKVVESDKPPLRLPLGEMAVTRIRSKLAAQLAELDAWEKVALDTAFPAGD